MASAVYTVKGMTCAAPARSRGTRPGAGAHDVAVDLDSGQITVISESPVEPEAVRAAVVAAAYEVVG